MSDPDPFISFQFELQIPKIAALGFFTEVSGLDMKIPATKSITTDSKGLRIIRQLPGDSLEYSDITVKRALNANMGLWTWRRMVEDGNIEEARCDGTIAMYSMNGTLLASWDFIKGWPSKLSGPELDAENDNVSMEEMTIVHEGLIRTL